MDDTKRDHWRNYSSPENGKIRDKKAEQKIVREKPDLNGMRSKYYKC
jgi:hypothetical protein